MTGRPPRRRAVADTYLPDQPELSEQEIADAVAGMKSVAFQLYGNKPPLSAKEVEDIYLTAASNLHSK